MCLADHDRQIAEKHRELLLDYTAKDKEHADTAFDLAKSELELADKKRELEASKAAADEANIKVQDFKGRLEKSSGACKKFKEERDKFKE